MNLAKRPLYSLCIMVVSANFLIAAPKLYLYLLPFDNNNNEQVIAWLGTGFTDMLTKEMTAIEGLFLRNRSDLENIMNNRGLLLKQPETHGISWCWVNIPARWMKYLLTCNLLI